MDFDKYLASLSDDEYFFIAENYLGKVDKPFHKPKITEKLVSFFMNPSNQEIILSQIDENEREILSAIYLADGLSEKEIIKLEILSSGMSLRAIMSLCDRLLLLREGYVYYVNPIFDEKCYLSFFPLLGTNCEEKKEGKLFNKEIIKGIISYFHTKGINTSAIHTERTKNSDYFTSVFPRFSKEGISYLSNKLINLTIFLSVLENDSKYYYVNREKLFSFLNLDLERIYAAIYAFENTTNNRNFESYYNFFTLCKNLNKIGKESISKVIRVLNTISKTPNPVAITDLLFLGILIEDDDAYYINQNLFEKNAKRDPLILDTDFSISYIENREKDDILFLFSSPISLDYSTSYKIDKDSIKAAFEIDINPEDIISYLEENSNSQLSQIIAERIRDWKRQYDMAKVYDGIIISTDKKNAQILDNLPLLQPHIISKITDTVFLLSRRNEDQWRKILIYTGLDMLSRTKRENGLLLSYKEEAPDLDLNISSYNKYLPLESIKREYSNKELKYYILGTINNKDTQDYYLDRLYNKLLINKDQIVEGVHHHQLCATGFDFQGKLALLSKIKGQRNTLCELETKDGKFLATVVELSNKTKDSVVTLSLVPEDKIYAIPVAKIFSLKILRSSIVR